MKIGKRKIALIVIVLCVVLGFGASVAIAGPERLASLQDAARGDWADLTAPFLYRTLRYEETVTFRDGDLVRWQLTAKKETSAVGITYRSAMPFVVNDTESVQPVIGEQFYVSYLLPGMSLVVEDEIRARGPVVATVYVPAEGVEVKVAVNCLANQETFGHSGNVTLTFGQQSMTAVGYGFEETFSLTSHTVAKIKHNLNAASESSPHWVVYQDEKLKAVFNFYEVIWSR